MLRLLQCCGAAVLVCGLLFAQSADEKRVADDAMSPRNANYKIEVSLDEEAKLLDGKLVLTWSNIQQTATNELWFHLYWNAWRNDRSSWLLERRLGDRSPYTDLREEDWAYIEIDSISLLAAGEYAAADLLPGLRYAAPDDGNTEDRTVVVVSLPRVVEPGETIDVELSWRAKIPRTFARTGFRGNYFLIGHWFPKLGVYEEEGWNCHQFHNETEFYSDYGLYDVSITVPDHQVLGATGIEINRRDNGDGTVTHRYRQNDVHGFTWTASPHFVVHEALFEEPGLPPVQMRLLLQSERRGQEKRYFDAMRATLKYYGSWYGAYPYEQVTIVDPAYGSRTGGMEYPTLFTGGSRLFNPPEGLSPEGVTVHEGGHQFWYAIVGNNEAEHAWLDEGLDTFSTARTLQTAYGDRRWIERYLQLPGGDGLLPLVFEEIAYSNWLRNINIYRQDAHAVDPDTPTYLYNPRHAYGTSYSKTALWLLTLERHLGWEVLRVGLSTFFERYSFQHPTPDQFFAVIEETSGQDLDWFFDQVFRSSVTFDYEVTHAASIPVEAAGWVGEGDALSFELRENGEDEEILYRNEVMVTRNGEGRFPVEVLLVFEDGHEVREAWDGQAHWQLFVVEYTDKLEYAIVDPERVLMLDLFPGNNSRLRVPEAEQAAHKWASRWMLWIQDLLTAFSFFV